ncbi:hypothetical protein FRC12_006250 [Ceratobasidium sp. 428]|nr:hypothetical protein FRC12_006250 [Ceratobasidium sp. 428]
MYTVEEPTYLDAIKEWKTANRLLAESLCRYLDACRTLEAVCLDQFHALTRSPLGVQTANEVNKELIHLTLHRNKLDQAQVAMSVIRNQSPRLMPVNIIPQEILSHIFHLAVISDYYNFFAPDGTRDTGESHTTGGKPNIKVPDFPYRISRVCTQWHRLVFSTPVLWSYIDLVVWGSYKDMFYTRASCFLENATGASLHLCIHEPTYNVSLQEIERLTDWLAPVFSRVRYLGISEGNNAPGMIQSVINCWFKNGNAGTIRGLTLLRYPVDQTQSIELTSVSNPGPWQFSISPHQLEEFFQPITVLRLHGVLLRWDSLAYRRLLHLRLGSGSITEWQLRDLISSNPQLRTLAFGLDVTETAARNIPQTSVHLRDLSILNLDAMSDITQAWTILRLLAPGRQPLKLAMQINTCASFDDFIQMEEPINTNSPFDVWLLNALEQLPHMQALYIQDQSYLDEYPAFNPGGGLKSNNERSSLRNLAMVHCELYLDALKQLLRAKSIDSLRLWDCSVTFDQTWQTPLDVEELESELRELVPHVECYEDSPNHSDLCVDWGFVDF